MSCTACGGKSDAYLCRGCWREIETVFDGAPEHPSLPQLINDVATKALGETRVYRTSRNHREPDEELAELEEEYGWRRARVAAHLRTKDARVTLPQTAGSGDGHAADQLAETRTLLTTWARHLVESRGATFALHVGKSTEGPVCAGHVHQLPVIGCQDQPAGCRNLHPDHQHYPSRRGCPDSCRRLHCTHASCARIRHGELTGTAAALVRWFLQHRDTIRYDEAAEQFHAQMLDLHARLLRSVDRSPAAIYAGPCRAEVDGACCVRELYAWPGKDEITCDGYQNDNIGCGTVHDPADRDQWLADELEDALVTLASLKAVTAKLLHLSWPPAATIRSWRFRGRLAVRSVDRNGAELFRGGDVLDLVRDWSEREQRRAQSA